MIIKDVDVTACDQFNSKTSIMISYNHPMWEDVLFSSEVNFGGRLDNYMIKDRQTITTVHKITQNNTHME